jgi:hypothetical protein
MGREEEEEEEEGQVERMQLQVYDYCNGVEPERGIRPVYPSSKSRMTETGEERKRERGREVLLTIKK